MPYLGLGRSAATMTQNAQRRMRCKDGAVTDDLDPRQMAAEDLMLGMRMTDGVSDERAARAAELLPEAPATLAALEERGLVEHAGGRWRPPSAMALRQRAVRRPVRPGALSVGRFALPLSLLGEFVLLQGWRDSRRRENRLEATNSFVLRRFARA